MKWLFLTLISMAFLGCSKSSSTIHVEIETTEGTIVVEVDTLVASITVANFLRYVDGGFYEDGSFFRTVRMDNQPTDSIRIEVIQGGANIQQREEFYEPIVLERTSETGLKHLDGVISMARGTPDSADHSIFICIGDQPSLDFDGMRNPDGQGFAAFGRVVSGMDVVRAIQAKVDENQTLVEPISIISARRRD